MTKTSRSKNGGSQLASFENQIRRRTVSVGVVGLGYVGLPLAMEFARAGFRTTGFEVDPKRVEALRKGRSHIPDVPSADVRRYGARGLFRPTTDFAALARMDAIIVCVPTPLRKSKDPDVSYILSALASIRDRFRKGQLIILESTTYPGTTRDLLLPELEKRGLRVGRDFFLAFSPERVDPGNKTYGIKTTPKVVGGITPACSRAASLLYAQIVDAVVPVSSPECAEMVKLLENTFRAVNIALVNEVALMCDRLGLNTWEVIDAAATKPFGFMKFYPGPGIGGHCIPLDPHYLSWKLKSLNFFSRFIELASEINSHMPEHLVRKIGQALNDRGKSVRGSRVVVVGVAYKKDVGDTRESPALDVVALLHRQGARVVYHDPFVPKMSLAGVAYRSRPLTAALLAKADAVVITTDHTQLPIAEIVRRAPLIVDARNATRAYGSRKIVRL